MTRFRSSFGFRSTFGARFSLGIAGLFAAVAACAASGALLGCEGLKGGTVAEAPTWKHRAGWNLRLDYSKQLVARTRRTGEPYERGQPEVDVHGRRVFVGSSDNGLYALNAVNGETIWRFETLGFVQGAPLYDPAEDVVYFGSNDGALYKVYAKNGRLLWRFMTNAEVSRRPVL